jgi:hypothetical protein
MKALGAHGPCPEHRHSFVNVSSVACGDKDPQAACDDPGPNAVGALAGDMDGAVAGDVVGGGGLDCEAAWSDAGQEN